MNNTKVVAVSGASGAGKTTIVKELANEFDCPFLLFDAHTDKSTYPQNMKNWLKNGANVSLIKTPKFVTALENLISKNDSRFIFIEEPFGKERDSMSSLIDYVVLLDQPLELCLARIIKRHTEQPNSDSICSISNYLDKYEDHFREIYISAVKQVRNKSDLIFNEVVSIKDTTNYISNWLKSNAN
jgi:uridine kinase